MSGTESPVVPSPPRPRPHLTAPRLPPLLPVLSWVRSCAHALLGLTTRRECHCAPSLQLRPEGGDLCCPHAAPWGPGRQWGSSSGLGAQAWRRVGSGGWCREKWPSGALTSPWGRLLSLLPPRARCSFGQALAHRPAFPRPTDRLAWGRQVTRQRRPGPGRRSTPETCDLAAQRGQL